MFEMILFVWLVGVADPQGFIIKVEYDSMAACEAELQSRAENGLSDFLSYGFPVARTNTICREVALQGELT